MKSSTVTVMMPVYNGEKYLKEAINSILGQTFSNFTFLIIDDGSTDSSIGIVKSYDDKRIKLLVNKKNLGISNTLNICIENADTTYVMRMDQDDISLATRLATQVAFMEARPDIGACGTWIKTIDERAGFVQKYLTDPEEVRASLLFNTSLAHSSVIMRKSVLDEHHLQYNADANHFEDYKLWVDLSRQSRLSNVPEVLLLYRRHSSSVSSIHGVKQKEGASQIRQDQLERLGLRPNEDDMRIHNSLQPKQGEDLFEFLRKQEAWLTTIRDANARAGIYTLESLSKILDIRWQTICGMNAVGGLSVWKMYMRSSIYRNSKQKSILDMVKVLVKCLLKRK